MGLGLGAAVGQPEAQMFQNSPDHQSVLDETHRAETALTMGANQGIHFEHFLDKSRPIAPESLGGDWGFQHGGDRIDLLPFAQSAAGQKPKCFSIR